MTNTQTIQIIEVPTTNPVVRKTRGFLTGLLVVASLSVGAAVVHLGGITPSKTNAPVAELTSHITSSDFPAVSVGGNAPAAPTGEIASLGTVTPHA